MDCFRWGCRETWGFVAEKLLFGRCVWNSQASCGLGFRREGSQAIHEKMKNEKMVTFISNSAFIPLPHRNFEA